jgi:hypothetical protein
MLDLNRILAAACPSRKIVDRVWEYRIDTHCVTFVIEAELVYRDSAKEIAVFHVHNFRTEPN